MQERFGDKVLKMGHLQEDGSMLVPMDCVIEAARALGTQSLAEAAETLKSGGKVDMLEAGEALVEKVAEARERKLRQLIRQFQSESNETNARHQWKQIERTVFGIEFSD
jgi:hypothetical protein